MCGIAGLSIAANDYTFKAAEAAAAMLGAIERRGRDATGAAWLDTDGNVRVTKLPVPATSFLTHRQKHLPSATPALILHTRYGTHGSSSNRDNLHPVIHDSIIGVHNGVLRNHGDLFKLMGRTPTAEVDTEGLMALLTGWEHPTTMLGKIEGDAALAWIDLRAPEYLHLACVTGRPLVVGQTKQGTLLFGSTRDCVNAGAKAGGAELVFIEDVKEETYMKVKDGIIIEHAQISGVKASSKAFQQQYAWTSGHDSKPTGYKPKAARQAIPAFSEAPSSCPA